MRSDERKATGETTGAVSVVIPVFNSAAILPELLERLLAVLRERGYPFEVILVNDGSQDTSWDVVLELSQQHSNVRGINLMRNFGQHNALLCGIRAVQYESIITMDDDLQHPPESIPGLLAALDAGADVIYGAPEREQHGWWRDLASRVTKSVLEQVAGGTRIRQVSAFRAFRTRLREGFATFRSPAVCLDVLLAWGTTRFGVVSVPHEPRRSGVSNYTMHKLIAHSLNMFTGFSSFPLRFACWLGFGCTLLGVLTLAWILGTYLFLGSVVPGFSFLASIITIFSGAQMLTLGIVGEYLSRVHFRLLEKPPYVVGCETGMSSDTAAEELAA